MPESKNSSTPKKFLQIETTSDSALSKLRAEYLFIAEVIYSIQQERNINEYVRVLEKQKNALEKLQQKLQHEHPSEANTFQTKLLKKITILHANINYNLEFIEKYYDKKQIVSVPKDIGIENIILFPKTFEFTIQKPLIKSFNQINASFATPRKREYFQKAQMKLNKIDVILIEQERKVTHAGFLVSDTTKTLQERVKIQIDRLNKVLQTKPKHKTVSHIPAGQEGSMEPREEVIKTTTAETKAKIASTKKFDFSNEVQNFFSNLRNSFLGFFSCGSTSGKIQKVVDNNIENVDQQTQLSK